MTLTEFLLARIAEDERSLQVSLNAGDAFHVDPHQLLADYEAKRRIVEEHRRRPRGPWFECAVCFDPNTTAGDYDFEVYPCPTLRILALPYADHPDYDEEWKP